ncbi:PREDICTED: inactive GDSL esterase/lipase-like protein 23 [Tarenaya hassleriana]|uniref:inactive GDSL esterase/lipase-like protein 23 n=1 Tax=Tarenaya hassleriana TaxID=28532 RepID=UPI00053C6CA3|nr:PREDICTED: inactive GDSL esterase/lipase-like protein 23 [Tarenaya hassleriana]
MEIKRSNIYVGMVVVVGVLLKMTVEVVGQNLPEAGLFSFGDSSYDVGNKRFLTNAFLPQTTWPYGKSTDDPNGRFSDGRIIPDFIAQFLKIPIAVPPALKPDGNFSRGANFAVADASVLGSPPESMSLSQQLSKFRKMGLWNDDYLSKSLFLFYIGTEDYLDFAKKNPSADSSAQQAFVTSVVSKIKQDLGLFYVNGARKFAFQTLAPLGCLPIVRQDYKTGDQCYETLNDLAKQHNEKIGPMLDALAKENPGFQYTIFDFYHSTTRRIIGGLSYRFLNTKNACCGIGSHNAFGCGYPNVHSNLCDYQRSYLFFDGRHNSEKANEAFAHLFFAADPNVVSPMNLRELVVYPPNMNMLESYQTPKSAAVSDSVSMGVAAA